MVIPEILLEECKVRAIRILIVTHAPLSAEFGAGQMAINLAEALRTQGHHVTLWSPHPLPIQTRWWHTIQQMRSKLDALIEAQKPFDVIDSPAALITPRASKSALVVVARSVQPDILYVVHSLSLKIESSIRSNFRNFCGHLYLCFQVFLVFQGWRRAKYILCLGSLEFQWMKKWFPLWGNKLIYYVNALSKSDRAALAEVCRHRKKRAGDSIRFLWIGRWAAHKGTDVLLDFIVKRTELRPQDTFTIAGCGTDAERDFPLVLIHSSRVKIIPSFERSQLYSLLGDHDVGLFTSKVEGWGLVLNEMLESGMPVFATPVGGVPDLQPFSQGMLVPFPPPLVLTADISATEVKDEYYRVFDWSQIAVNYSLSILTQLG